jgi:hypothetical protein
MYYAMSIPELFVLSFVIALWVLSIVCCVKRYKKISTIERAELPLLLKKQTLNHSQTNETPSCTTSKNFNSSTTNLNNLTITTPKLTNFPHNQTNTISNINNKTASKNHLLVVHDDSATTNRHTTKIHHASNKYDLFAAGDKFIKMNRIHPHFYSNQSNNSNQNSFSMNSTLSVRQKTNRKTKSQSYNQHKPQLYKQYSIHPQYTIDHLSVSDQSSNQLAQQNRKTSLHASNVSNNVNSSIQLKSNFLNSTNTKLDKNYLSVERSWPTNGLLKSSSEPTLKDIENSKTKKKQRDQYLYVNNEREQILRSSSSELKIKHKRTIDDDGELINPKLIPKFVRKSLIDLHKKSVWNLANRLTVSNYSSNAASGNINIQNSNQTSHSTQRHRDFSNPTRILGFSIGSFGRKSTSNHGSRNDRSLIDYLI